VGRTTQLAIPRWRVLVEHKLGGVRLARGLVERELELRGASDRSSVRAVPRGPVTRAAASVRSGHERARRAAESALGSCGPETLRAAGRRRVSCDTTIQN